MPFKVSQKVFFKVGLYGYDVLTILKILSVNKELEEVKDEPEYNCQWGAERGDFYEDELISINQKWKLFRKEKQRKK